MRRIPNLGGAFLALVHLWIGYVILVGRADGLERVEVEVEVEGRCGFS
jgi:hypothetical protein